ncbi:hemin uptake protein HemP [Roseobacter sp. EG26]|uniref:hemin uptake protein HemP n=1 Tax=Roseobacter sp. EG26 TaxID=3412477 RepID=UPI00262D57EE|nr:hemin uptake protein HemP [uncultured Roseobacter sp.]
MIILTQTPPKPLESTPEDPQPPAYDARMMVGDGTQARLVLDDQTYFLRITRAGKLILTK